MIDFVSFFQPLSIGTIAIATLPLEFLKQYLFLF